MFHLDVVSISRIEKCPESLPLTLVNMTQTRAAITGVSCWLPEDKLTNADLEKLVNTTNEWILDRSGVSERRILRDPEKATAYLGTKAAESLLKKMNIDPMTIDLLILSTATPDYQFPATANIVADAIGAFERFRTSFC